MSDLSLSSQQIDYLLSPKAIRERAAQLFVHTQQGKGHFHFHEEKFAPTVKYVMEVIHKNYPDLKIPFHSRWGHFRAGKIDRVKMLKEKIQHLDPLEQARIQLDLVIPSVLLDAGAGAAWKYQEQSSGKSFARSEGLGLASLYLFLDGALSSDGKSLRSDGSALQKTNAALIEKYFQVSAQNPLVGVEGRVQLLQNLGKAMKGKIFRNGRPGNIVDYLVEEKGKSFEASDLLRAVLDGLGVIWPGRLQAGAVNLGDVWQHSQLAAAGTFECLVPFHKLSQWMTYSLIEPMQEAGLQISGVEKLTGLAEYRNGGLLLDSGLITLKDPKHATQAQLPSSDLIIEWRALTVHLLDRIGLEVQKNLGKSAQEFPLAKVLEGGTWWAGRFLAQEKRANGDPPLQLKSDGTVF